jgi:hypothetical protein
VASASGSTKLRAKAFDAAKWLRKSLTTTVSTAARWPANEWFSVRRAPAAIADLSALSQICSATPR